MPSDAEAPLPPPSSPPPPRRPPRAGLLVLVPLALSFALAARTISRDSCTVDEFGNLPLAVAYWRGGTLHIDPGTPPLTRWIQGVPLFRGRPALGATPAETDSIRTAWDLGYRFEAAHRKDYHRRLVEARSGSLALLLATVLGVFVLARDVAGPRPALAAALLAAACPNLLAHGRLVTPDIGLACFAVWSVWSARRARREGSLAAAALTGLLAGAASLAKFSGLLFVPVLGLAVTLTPRRDNGEGTGAAERLPGVMSREPKRADGRRARGTPGGGARAGGLARLVAFGVASLLPMYAAYGFPPPGLFHGWPTPFPAGVVKGIEAQRAESPYPAYLLGELREGGGWVHYHLVALLLKTPLPVLALFAVALVRVLRERRREFTLPLLVAALFFVAFGAATRRNVGIRYVLPVLPLLHVVTAAAFLPARAGAGSLARRMMSAGPVTLLLLAIATGVGASLRPLAYFNGTERLIGGKRAALVDSNLDWGQALPELREWQKREKVDVVQLAYFGRIDPSIYGVRWRTLKSQPVRGPAAISATFVAGRSYAVRMKEQPFLDGTRAWSAADTWRWLKDLPPDEELGGGSILVWKDIGRAWDEAKKRREGGA